MKTDDRQQRTDDRQMALSQVVGSDLSDQGQLIVGYACG